jgi:type I protein arginine methyltransferase
MYSLHGYGSMIVRGARTDAYIEALRQTVKPGRVVVDIGTGPGIWALLACQFGARKVYAIEPDDVIAIAREAAAANGFEDRIEFIQGLSTQVTLPELADVIVSDIRGVLPFYEVSLSSLADARQRLLAPGGVLIPLRDTLWVSVVHAPEAHDSYITPWNFHGLNTDPIRKRVTNTWKKEPIKAHNLVTEPQCWATVNYDRLESYNACGTVTWTIGEESQAHGLAVWFDSSLIEGVGFSNAPSFPEIIYGRAFFPWPESVLLKPGDEVSVTLRATLIGGFDYVWSWDTQIAEDGRPKAAFRQSTFYAAAIAPGQLHKRAADYRPMLTESGEMEKFVLGLMDGQRTVDMIAREVRARFPEYCKTHEDALTSVGDVSRRCSR